MPYKLPATVPTPTTMRRRPETVGMFDGLAGFAQRAELPELAEIRLQNAAKLVIEAESASAGASQRIQADMNRWLWGKVRSLLPFLPEDVQDDWRQQCAEQPDCTNYAADLIDRMLELSALTDDEKRDFWQQAKPVQALITALAKEQIRAVRGAARRRRSRKAAA